MYILIVERRSDFGEDMSPADLRRLICARGVGDPRFQVRRGLEGSLEVTATARPLIELIARKMRQDFHTQLTDEFAFARRRRLAPTR